MKPVLVTGVPRSGASIVAQLLVECGAFAGNQLNKMFENEDIKILEQNYYLSQGGDASAQFPIISTSDLYIPTNWRDKVLKILSDQGLSNKHKVWMYKSSLVSLIWPVWEFAFPEAKWVIVRRKPTEIIQSCKMTGYMTAFKNKENLGAIKATSQEQGWKWMIDRYEEKFVELISHGADVKVVWPHRIAQGDYSQMIELVNWLGLEWSSEILPMIDFKFLKVRRKNGIS